ncbi:MAG: TIGR03067 domain-containing protein [Planctomycetes bacterium]|nr:TIGR03067 domain-containing protein [Planctomycetota bacterium]
MRTQSCIQVVCLLLCSALFGEAAAGKKPPPDPNSLDGTWEIVELTAYGKKVDFNTIKGTKFIFAKDKLTIQPGSDKIEEFEKRTFTVKLDPVKQPAQVELTALDGKNKGLVSPGIYEIKGDTLRWCQSDATTKPERPKDFTSPEKSPIYLFTLKRGK